MRIELDQGMFARLVQLYLLCLALSIGGLVLEVMSPSWSAFSEASNALIDAHFGTPGERVETAVLAITGVAFIWHLASSVALFRFRRWGRIGFWASLIPMLLTEFIPGISSPVYFSPWVGMLNTVGEGLFGAILLLAYSRDHGGMWFKSKPEKLSETF